VAVEVRFHAPDSLKAERGPARELGCSTRTDQRTASAMLTPERQPLSRNRGYVRRRTEAKRASLASERAQHVRMDRSQKPPLTLGDDRHA